MRDFCGISDPNNTKQCISRLVREGALNRILQKPKYIKLLNSYASSDPHFVTEFLVRGNGWSIVLSRNAALNILGLPDGMTAERFFSGVSRPRSKEIMRIFHDVEMV